MFSRVVSLQGPRQAGKSFIARELLPKKKKKALYLTFDLPEVRRFAGDNPESFIKKYNSFSPLILDEAQKVPDIFDTIKYFVDIKPAPGQFILLGSTEFSREAKVRESLTGRLSQCRVYPFNLSESLKGDASSSKDSALLHEKPRFSRGEVLRHLDLGGFPGIFSVREEGIRQDLFDGWLKLTCDRDVFQFPGQNANSDLTMRILQTLPSLDVPDTASLARRLAVSGRTIDKHLKLLQMLFAIIPLPAFPMGTGKTRYFSCDVGLGAHLGASLQRKLVNWVLLEQLSQRACRMNQRARYYYYRGARGGIIDLVIEDRSKNQAKDQDTGQKPRLTAIKVLAREGIDLREFEILRAFKKKCADQNMARPRLIALGPFSRRDDIDGVELYPWEALG